MFTYLVNKKGVTDSKKLRLRLREQGTPLSVATAYFKENAAAWANFNDQGRKISGRECWWHANC